MKKRIGIFLLTLLFVLTISPFVYSSGESNVAFKADKKDITFDRPKTQEEAKELIATLEGDAVAEALPEEYIAQAMNYQDATQSIAYWRVSENGNAKMISAEDCLSASKDAQNAKFASVLTKILGFSQQEYGYMKLITTAIRIDAPETCVDERNEYFIVSARLEWLYRPTWTEKGTLTLSYNAIFDDSYKNLALLSENNTCEACEKNDKAVYIVTDSKNEKIDVNENAKGHLSTTYKNLFSCEAVYENSMPCTHKVTENTTLYIRERVYSQSNDFTVSASYHPKSANIKLSFIGGLHLSILPKNDTVYHGIDIIATYKAKNKP